MAVKKSTNTEKGKKGQKVSFAKESPVDKDAEAHTQGSSAEKSIVANKPKATDKQKKKSISPKETKKDEKQKSQASDTKKPQQKSISPKETKI